MKTKTNIFLIWFRKLKRIKINRNILTFGLFLIISSFLWLLNTLNKSYSDTIKYPIKFTNLPKDIQLLEELPERINIEITGHGYDILSYKLNYSKPPIIVNLKKQNLRQLDENHYFILAGDIFSTTEKRIKGKLNLQSISPDTIHFITTHTETKKVPVEIAFTYNPGKEYIITERPKITPDSVSIKGPIQFLEKIKYIKTKDINYKDIKTNIDRYIPLESVKNVSIEPNRVKLVIPVEKYTETDILAEIQPINLPDSLSMTCIPESIRLSFKVPISDYKNIKVSDFLLQADYSKARNSKVPLIITEKPDFIQDITIQENEVSFVLHQKSHQ